ncbi:MAG TPA: hypothetical protein VK112_05210, partial [Fodinibius sp.]|nr:hypothetical protein [Fodinibius sp.]
PAAADLHRIKGQILSEQGHPKKAIDALIEAARLDPDNESALIMLGNIYASDCSDADTAITFYERALQTNPDNYMAINNIGSNLANAGKYGDARRYFELAHELNPDYPNTLHGLALIAARQQNPREAFRYARKTFLKLDPGASAQLYRKNLALIKEEAQKYIAAGEGLQALVAPYKNELEQAGGKPITIEASPGISTPAKIEIAEVYGRERHRVKYQPGRPGLAHLVMHELGHLDRQIQARTIGANQLFTSTRRCKEQFKEDHPYITNKLEKRRLPADKVDGFIEQIFDGLNGQLYNTPIDLFIERKLFEDFPHLRPYQFLSLLGLEHEYIQSATNEEVQQLVPQKIIRINKILSLVNTLQFKELYGVDLIDQFHATQPERREARELYKEWKAYDSDDQYGAEYALIELWAEDLGLSAYFTLAAEPSAPPSSLESTVDTIEADPLALLDDSEIGEEYFSNRGLGAAEMATIMYIVDALQYFKGKSTKEVKKVGLEIAMLGRSGIDTDSPDKKYSLTAIPDTPFSGRHLLAYMYAAFKEFDPSVDTGIDFEAEYQQARQLLDEQGE